MKKEEIARIIADRVYFPREDGTFEYAVQLFMEKVVLPDEVESWDAETMEKYILEFLTFLGWW